jgi:hypothetical protein
MIFCLVLGDHVRASFPIEIPCKKKVGEFRKLITEINPKSFINIDAKDLVLWQVNISDTDVERIETLNAKPASDIDIKQELGGREMSSRKDRVLLPSRSSR